MDGSDRAAILLLGMGEKNAAQVLKYLQPRQVQKVGKAMATMNSLNNSQLESVIDEFLSESEKQVSIGVNSEEFIRNALVDALGEDRASGFVERIMSSNEESGLDHLKWLDARTIFDLIRNEHPQTIATILTYLDSEQAAEVVSHFSEEKRVDLLLRMTSIASVKPEALTELGKIIEEQLAGASGRKTASLGGLKSVADLINFMEGTVESQVLEGIKETDESLCEQIQEQMFVFENLIGMDGRSIQTLLRDVASDVLLIALKGADEKVKEKIFANMSKCAAELMKDDLEEKGPVKVSEVAAAQKEILETARRLAEAGELALGGKGGEEII